MNLCIFDLKGKPYPCPSRFLLIGRNKKRRSWRWETEPLWIDFLRRIVKMMVKLTNFGATIRLLAGINPCWLHFNLNLTV